MSVLKSPTERLVLTIKNSNVLWVDSPEGYRTIIGKHVIYNENVTDYKTSQYATTLLNIFRLNQESILSTVTSFIQKELGLNIVTGQIKRKLGKPCFNVSCGNKGSIIWNKTRIKDSDNNPITVVCYLIDNSVDTVVFRSEPLNKKSKFQSLIRFLNGMELKTSR